MIKDFFNTNHIQALESVKIHLTHREQSALDDKISELNRIEDVGYLLLMIVIGSDIDRSGVGFISKSIKEAYKLDQDAHKEVQTLIQCKRAATQFGKV